MVAHRRRGCEREARARREDGGVDEGHGIEYVLTFNRDDFAGFDGVGTIVPGTAMPA
jgi:hypothetical protein